MSAFRKLTAYVLGHNTDMDAIGAEIEEAHIPVSTEDCRGCGDPCDEGVLRAFFRYVSRPKWTV